MLIKKTTSEESHKHCLRGGGVPNLKYQLKGIVQNNVVMGDTGLQPSFDNILQSLQTLHLRPLFSNSQIYVTFPR